MLDIFDLTFSSRKIHVVDVLPENTRQLPYHDLERASQVMVHWQFDTRYQLDVCREF